MEDGLIVGVDLSKDTEQNCLKVGRVLNDKSMQIIKQFYGEEAEEVYEILIDIRKVKNNTFDLINAHSKGYQKALDDMMQYTFFNDNKDKVLVLNKEKIKEQFNVSKVIFEEEDKNHE